MPQNNGLPEILAHLRTADGLIVQLRNDPVGVLEVPEMENVLIAIHLGAPTRLDCCRGGRRFVGTAVHGGIDIIPDQTPSRWEIFDNTDAALLLGLPKRLLRAAAKDCGGDDVGSQPGDSLGSMFSMQPGTIVCIGEPGLTVRGQAGSDSSDLLLERGQPTSLPLRTKWEYAHWSSY